MADSKVVIGGALSSMFLIIVAVILTYFFLYTPDGQAIINPNYYNEKAEKDRLEKEKEDKEKADTLKNLFPPSTPIAPAVTISKAATTVAPVAPLATFTPKDSPVKNRKRGNACLDVPGASLDNSTQLETWDCVPGKVNQMFTLDEKKRLVVKHSGKCAGAANSQTENGTKVIQWDCLDKDDQKWEYSSSGELRPLHAKGKCLDASDIGANGDGNGGGVVIWDCHGGDNQKWYI